MYRPDYTKKDDIAIVQEIIEKFPLGLLVSIFENSIYTNFFPFFMTLEGEKPVLWTHMAKSNFHWKKLGHDVTINFIGPQRYISPVMYQGTSNVPTWNYVALEMRGAPQLINGMDELNLLLHQSVNLFEKRNGTGWIYDMGIDERKKMEAAIVGVRIDIHFYEAKIKLSQNRNQRDYESVADYLRKSTTESDIEMLRWMLKTKR